VSLYCIDTEALEGNKMSKVQKHNRKVLWSDRAFLLLPFLVMGIVLWSGGEGQKELQAEQAHYCDMVESGAWPDYKDTYDESCK